MHAMLALCLLFTFMLFVESLCFAIDWLLGGAGTRPKLAFALIERLHWTLLVLSLINLIGAMLGSQRVLLIG